VPVGVVNRYQRSPFVPVAGSNRYQRPPRPISSPHGHRHFTRAQTPAAAVSSPARSATPYVTRSAAPRRTSPSPRRHRRRAVAAAVPPYVLVARSATPSTRSTSPAALLRQQRGERPFYLPLPLSPPPTAPPAAAAGASPASPQPGHPPWLAGALSPRAPATRSMKCACRAASTSSSMPLHVGGRALLLAAPCSSTRQCPGHAPRRAPPLVP
jgi:hypothetical protein